MGMYSSVVECDVGVVTGSEQKMKEWLAQKKAPAYVKKDAAEEYLWWKDLCKEVMDAKYQSTSFSEIFDDKKILGYWYEGFGFFVRDLAQFVEGSVVWQSEGGDERVCMSFESGMVRFESAEWKWAGERVVVEEWFNNIPALPKQEQILRRL